MLNESLGLEQFHQELSSVMESLKYPYRIIYVEDGSTDCTLEMLIRLAEKDPRVTVVELSRNFGHQAALSAGMDIAGADYLITMDGDGQHPPSLIPDLVSAVQRGYDMVLTRRMDQQEVPQAKQWTSRMFYRLLNLIGSTQLEPGGADFRLVSAQVAVALRSLPEHHRFLRGMVAWVGFRTTVVEFTPNKRISGSAKYSIRKMLGLAMDAVSSFSLVPLQMAMVLGALFLVVALTEVLYVSSIWLRGRGGELALGWVSLMFVLLFLGGAVLITLGIIGLYVGYIFQEVKRRPVFIIRAIHQFPTATSTGRPHSG
ncbi:MAG: glycosyltransferase family 2 protein [Acidobacteriia bacterium]|nr:glycosyltransferase family 2 protein [Terriglobia bacterium]